MMRYFQSVRAPGRSSYESMRSAASATAHNAYWIRLHHRYPSSCSYLEPEAVQPLAPQSELDQSLPDMCASAVRVEPRDYITSKWVTEPAIEHWTGPELSGYSTGIFVPSDLEIPRVDSSDSAYISIKDKLLHMQDIANSEWLDSQRVDIATYRLWLKNEGLGYGESVSTQGPSTSSQFPTSAQPQRSPTPEPSNKERPQTPSHELLQPGGQNSPGDDQRAAEDAQAEKPKPIGKILVRATQSTSGAYDEPGRILPRSLTGGPTLTGGFNFASSPSLGAAHMSQSSTQPGTHGKALSWAYSQGIAPPSNGPAGTQSDEESTGSVGSEVSLDKGERPGAPSKVLDPKTPGPKKRRSSFTSELGTSKRRLLDKGLDSTAEVSDAKGKSIGRSTPPRARNRKPA